LSMKLLIKSSRFDIKIRALTTKERDQSLLFFKILRSRFYSTSNNSKIVQDRAAVLTTADQ